jgi:hypothetical protein
MGTAGTTVPFSSRVREAEITVRLHGNDEDAKQKLNRAENLRAIPRTDPDFARLYTRRGDAESVNRPRGHALPEPRTQRGSPAPDGRPARLRTDGELPHAREASCTRGGQDRRVVDADPTQPSSRTPWWRIAGVAGRFRRDRVLGRLDVRRMLEPWRVFCHVSCITPGDAGT